MRSSCLDQNIKEDCCSPSGGAAAPELKAIIISKLKVK